jgi:hypothetical protein
MSLNPRSAHLALSTLEDRAVPATAIYTALTQTLTVTADEGDRLVVAGLLGKPTGYLSVTETQAGSTVFTSDAAKQAVRNLVVKFGMANSGDLTLGSTAVLGGSLSVGAALSTQSVSLFGTVGGNFTYNGAAAPYAADDTVNLESTAVVGGYSAINLGAGTNTVRLKGGTIRGGLAITGGAGQDRIEMVESSDLTVGGSAAFKLGDGLNTVLGIATHQIHVGGMFTYTGGAGNDTFDLDGSGASLSVGTDARFTLGTPVGFDANTAAFESLSAGRSVSFVGGLGSDTVEVSGALSAWGNVAVNLGNGENSFDSNLLGSGTNTIGGSFTYTGGMNGDSVSLDNTTVGRGVVVSLGEAAGSGLSYFGAGTKGPGQVTVYGGMKITDGSAAAAISLNRLYVGGGLTLMTGAGQDQVSMDDTNVAGSVLIDLGAGNDMLMVETGTSNGGGPLGGVSTIGGSFTVRGGDGNDQVVLAGLVGSGQAIQFGGRVVLTGGNGSDTLLSQTGATFLRTGNAEDFEVATGPAIK